jgi:hypothetical protein
MMVSTFEIDDVRIGATWGGGRLIRVYVDVDGGPVMADEWDIWNEDWDSPLITQSREAFEAFVRGRLEEPGLVFELVALATA